MLLKIEGTYQFEERWIHICPPTSGRTDGSSSLLLAIKTLFGGFSNLTYYDIDVYVLFSQAHQKIYLGYIYIA